MACTRECSVCYSESGPFVKLGCSHEFCTGCVKQWYQKGTGTGCPMCRRPMYWKGFHKHRDQWNKESYEFKTGEVFMENLESYVEEALESLAEETAIIMDLSDIEDARWAVCDFIEALCDDDMKPVFRALRDLEILTTKEQILSYYRAWFHKDLMKDICKMEKTLRFLKSQEVDHETIDEILYYMDYYSDRGINRWVWHDEPAKEQLPRYGGKVGGGVRCGKRCRALEDVWSEMSFYLLV